MEWNSLCQGKEIIYGKHTTRNNKCVGQKMIVSATESQLKTLTSIYVENILKYEF